MDTHRYRPPGRALFAISSLGLGHATRSLPIILDHLGRGWRLTIVSSGNALALLRAELDGAGEVVFQELQDYPPLERGTGWRLYWYLLVDLLITRRRIRQEHRWLAAMGKSFDFIFSDGRYGFYSETTPCVIVTHQVAFMPPRLFKRLFHLGRWLNLLALQKFDHILIPDFPNDRTNLSGVLSHSPHLNRHPHSYIGLLSSYSHQNRVRDIDYLFIISGYLLQHKASFLDTLINQATELPGRKVFILGQQRQADQTTDIETPDDITIYSMADGPLRQELFNRAKQVVTRAGYSTIMDLVEHDKTGLLIPTPNQTEQEYLAEYLGNKNYFAIGSQQRQTPLRQALAGCGQTTRFSPPWRTAQSVTLVRNTIERLSVKRFFTIIVPAHNEEAELRETLACLLALNYPADRCEIIVVENGSTDATLAIARQLARRAADRAITVLQSAKGVSNAKNLGLAHCSPGSEWVVFCDADTHLNPHFLNDLNTRLSRCRQTMSAGTCTIIPRGDAGLAKRFWFRFYDRIHQLTATSYSLQFARTPIAKEVGFRSDLEMAEDLLFLKECCEHGGFLFLETSQASTSSRRFDSVGYLRLSLFWAIGALLPMQLKRKLKYDVIR